MHRNLVTALLVALLCILNSPTVANAEESIGFNPEKSATAEIPASPLDLQPSLVTYQIDSSRGTVNVDASSSDTEIEAVDFAIDYANSSQEITSGRYSVHSEQPGVSGVIEISADGVRVITEIQSASAPEDFEYSFNVPESTDLIPVFGGFLIADQSTIYGKLLSPWAFDATGKSVPTTYTWQDGHLFQHVQLNDPTIVFPVSADPAWTYTYSYDVSKTAAATKTLLKTCFNCYFPVTGAPRAFPSTNQLLPLWVGVLNFECRFAGESTATNYFGFAFDATKNHVDQAGSYIHFDFVMVGAYRKLVVSASIVNPFMNNSTYKDGAKNTWAMFASKVSNG